MKNLNKTILATTFITSLFLGQSVMAGEEGSQDKYSGHPHASDVSSFPSQTESTVEKQRVNYQLKTKAEESSIDLELFPDVNR